MDAQARYHQTTVRLLAVTAIIMGVLLSLLTWAMDTALDASDTLPSDGSAYSEAKSAPFILFALASAGFGWALTKIAEVRGVTSWLVGVASAVLVIGIGCGFSAGVLSLWSPQIANAMIVSALAHLGGGWFALARGV
ncbi:MAG: hypothetical protein GY842_02945 [bacterium]|nr:hypothetical protein [bacterium]